MYVCCKKNKKREFIVEMQMTWTESFKKRVLLNASKAYVAQTVKGMSYESLQPVYALNFVNARFLEDAEDYYHYYHLVHDKYTNKVIDGLHLIFVELPKFKPTTFSERKMQVLWLRFLTEIDERTMVAPPEMLENAEVNEALEIIERAAFTDEEMRAYDKFWDRVSTQRTYEEEIKQKAANMIKKAEAEAEARAEAKAKTMAEAIAEEKIKKAKTELKEELKAELKQKNVDTARKLKAMNVMTIEQIAEAVGLTGKEIEEL